MVSLFRDNRDILVHSPAACSPGRATTAQEINDAYASAEYLVRDIKTRLREVGVPEEHCRLYLRKICWEYHAEGRGRCWVVMEGAETAKTALYASPTHFANLSVTVEDRPTGCVAIYRLNVGNGSTLDEERKLWDLHPLELSRQGTYLVAEFLVGTTECSRDEAQAVSNLLRQQLGVGSGWAQRASYNRKTTTNIELEAYELTLGQMERNADALGSGLTIHLTSLGLPPPAFPLIVPTPTASEAGTFDGAGTVDGAENFSSRTTTPTATTPTAATFRRDDLHARFQAAYRVQEALAAEQADLDKRVIANEEVLAKLQEELEVDASHPEL